PETYLEAEQVCADIPSSNWRYQNGKKIISIERRLYISRSTDIVINVSPPDPAPGQKILVSARTPFPPEEAELIYIGQSRPMRLNGVLYTAELTAADSEEIKINFQNNGEIIERSVRLVLKKPELLSMASSTSSTAQAGLSGPASGIPTPNSLQFKGNKTIVFVQRNATGEIDFPEEQRREETLYLEAEGVENSVNISARVLTTTQETVDKKEDIMVKLWTDRWSAYMGDFNETVRDSYLGLHNKNLNGFRFSYFPGQTELNAIIGKELGADQEEYFYGNDSQGPYNALYPPAVPGSEQIFLDGQPLQRDKDYYFDHRGGKIIFRQSIIAKHQLVRLLYQSEATPYKNQFTYLRAAQEFGHWRVRVDAAQAKDLAEEIVTGSAPPQEKKQYTAQLLYRKAGTTLNIEKALAEKTLRESAVSRDGGEAEALALEYDNQKNLKLSLREIHSAEGYRAIGNPVPPGMQENKNFAEFYQPGYTLRVDTYRKDLNAAGASREKENYYKIFVKENFWPELQYWSKHTQKEILSGTQNTVHQYSGDNLELAKSLSKHFRLGLTGSQENIENNLESLPYEYVETYGAYLQTQQLSQSDFILGKKYSQKELRNAEEIISLNAEREETYARLNIYPGSRVRFGMAYQEILDKTAGNSELLDTNYSLSPAGWLNSNGNYSIETLVEELSSANHRVQKQRGNFLLRCQPLNFLRLTLRYAPNISIAETNLPYAFFAGQNAAADLAPFSWSSLKYTYTANHAQTRDTARLPENILKTEAKNQENMYILRLLPLETLDLELKYRHKDREDDFLDELVTASLVYSEGSGYELEQGLNIYYRPGKKLQLNGGYAQSTEQMNYLNLPSFNVLLEREIYNSSLQYQLNERWTAYLSCDLLKSTDLLASANNVTYEYTPGIGLACRYTEFRLRYDYKKTESAQGEKSLRHKHNLGLEYYWNSHLQSSLTAEKVKSEIPAYETTDLLAKISASF
ncbi:MAG: hypothetical protein LBD99_03585, partial [Candidatus Margulisbacteria bacterium]|nr:hypothetical protein [Candidatus Margulisiibacteriota bacterium]